jgi:hypothetical protein
VRFERSPGVGLHPQPGEPDHLGHGGAEVVVAHLAVGHAAQGPEGVDVSLQKSLLAARGRYPVNALAGEGQPQGEQVDLDRLAAQLDDDVAEIDLGFLTGVMALPDEHLARAAPGRGADLRFALGHIIANRLVDDIDHLLLVDQPGEDPPHGVALLLRRGQIRAQPLVDDRLELVQLRCPARVLLALGRPRRAQCLGNGPIAHVVPALQLPTRLPDTPARASRRMAA